MSDKHADKTTDPERDPRVGALLAAARSLHDAVRPETAPLIGPALVEHADGGLP
jgi:hypothetical protein